MNIATRFTFVFLGSLVMSSTAFAVTVSFRQNVGGYTLAQDTWLPKQNPNTNYGSNPGLGAGKSGAPDEEHTLVGFYGIFGFGPGQIPPGATINSATLFMGASGFTVPANGEIHQMFVPWTDSTATWNSMSGGLNNVPAGELDPTPVFSGSFGPGTFPVTSVVQSWSSGSPNYGFGIIPTSTGTVVWQSSEAGNSFARPQLTVDYAAVPEPTGLILAVAAGAAVMGAVRRR